MFVSVVGVVVLDVIAAGACARVAISSVPWV